MLKGHLVIAIACLAVLVSTASAIQVDETTGPFQVSFDLPIDGAEVHVNEPIFGSVNGGIKLSSYGDINLSSST